MWILNCQKCGKSNEYSEKSNYTRALKGSRLCNGCSRDGQKRTPEQRLKISEATKAAMKTPKVYDKFITSYTPENRKKRSESTMRQMSKILQTETDKVLWSWKISSGTKTKWNQRPLHEQQK